MAVREAGRRRPFHAEIGASFDLRSSNLASLTLVPYCHKSHCFRRIEKGMKELKNESRKQPVQEYADERAQDVSVVLSLLGHSSDSNLFLVAISKFITIAAIAAIYTTFTLQLDTSILLKSPEPRAGP